MQCVQRKYHYLIYFLLLGSIYSYAKPFYLNTSITIDVVEGYGLELRGIVLNFDSLSKPKSSYVIQIASAVLPENKGHIKNIILQCNDGEVSKIEIACNDGMLSFQDPLASANQAAIQFHRKKNGDFFIILGEFNLAGGSAKLNADMHNGMWNVRLKSSGISLAKLREVLPSFPQLFSKGIMRSDITFIGNGDSLRAVQGNALIEKLAFTNQDSTVVGEEVATKFTFSSKRRGTIWESEIQATTFEGELYFDPIFIDVNKGPKDLYGKINWRLDSNQIELTSLHFEDSNALHLEVSTVIDYVEKKAVAPIQANIQYALFPNVYQAYMQPLLLDTNIANLESNGKLSGSIIIDGNRIVETDLKLDYLSLVDTQNRFSINKLNGNFGWGESYLNKEYEFRFESADIYKLRFEASNFAFLNSDQALILKQPVSVPMLDGAINIESFQVQHPGKLDQSLSMDISLTPVSMSKLSTTFGWPEMNGNLAGYAPNVTYKKGDVEVQGALLIRGFGGTTTIHNLSAADLFSVTPRLSADVQLKNLDLSSLTETFSFGQITGRLEGSIKNLQFVSWSPVQFDAWFGTPKDDISRHRISQTAVDNLTQVGNGASDILSKSFLKFFDSFGYEKLGLGCTLKNNTCKMRGVNPKGRGFYIVKGSGVPRIDIVGFTDEVSWSVLTARLKRVVSTKEVIVN